MVSQTLISGCFASTAFQAGLAKALAVDLRQHEK